ncbi:non-ribosomal peptide synthetase [Planomonospora sp. ID67723]|uniref:non-ribosomal peptide synthetase n=1 Tax=Planomonospora sp. ID67723 TaxID=2738134 RepID=UPI0018C36C58|nr:non-ribosomal peptide synthetase [Planomonospora sp. ID67723]MBG0831418.1 non-ribosomal peptide synthetase [Planomonospora sp. ID67723]
MRSEPAGVPEMIAGHAQRHPHALAVTDGQHTLTYGQLVTAARCLADDLAAHGLAPKTAVGLLAPRSVRAVVGQLAVWWAGGHYVPLDPAYPRARTAQMLQDAGVPFTIGDKKPLESAGIPARRSFVLPADMPAGGPTGTPAPPYDAEALAYVMYTSGSTGRPKAVAVPHRAVTRLVTAPEYVTLTPRDRVLFHSPATFDAATFEVWAPLAHGAAVVVSAAEQPSLEDLARDVQRHGVTVAFFTTALFHQLATRRSRVFDVLRTVLVGGEALSPRHARSVLRAFPWLELVNVYGPTEATTFTTAHRVRDGDCDAAVPIGVPVNGATAHVLGADGEPVPPGTTGELWIGGPRLARGYLGRPDHTAERFIEHAAAGRLYRSGDLVSVRPDGALDFHGRVDDQVKVRGFRIEPGEIEHVLREHPAVDEVAVVVRRSETGDARLAVFVVPGEDRWPGIAALRADLAERLPAHLVPDLWTVLERLPLAGTGKVDRRALAERPLTEEPVTEPSAAPAAMSPIQQAVAEVWARALDAPVTGPEADFIALGGHSLLALGIVEDLREELGAEISLPDFFAFPTVAGHAELIERALLERHGDPAQDATEDADEHHA